MFPENLSFASPASAVSLYFFEMSRPVSFITRMTLSSEIFLESLRKLARLTALIARIAATALRSMQGICTSPQIGSQVRPR